MSSSLQTDRAELGSGNPWDLCRPLGGGFGNGCSRTDFGFLHRRPSGVQRRCNRFPNYNIRRYTGEQGFPPTDMDGERTGGPYQDTKGSRGQVGLAGSRREWSGERKTLSSILVGFSEIL